MRSLRHLCVSAVFALTISSGLPAWANPPPPDSEDAKVLSGYRAWVESQNTQDGYLCCSIADGRLVDARIKDGHWQVRFHPGNDIGAPTDWVVVDENAVLRKPNPTGYPIAWWFLGQVRCFAPPSGV